MYNKKPNVSHLRIFGSEAYAHISKDERSKLDSKSRKSILLGYGNEIKGYRLYDIESKKIFHARDVIFDETKCMEAQKEILPDDPENQMHFNIDSDVRDSSSSEELDNTQRRSSRISRAPDRYGFSCSSTTSCEPTTVNEALNGPDSDKWRKAMECEMQAMDDNKVWDIVQQPAIL